MSYVLVVFELLFFYSLILSNICFILSWFFFFLFKQKTAYDMRIRYWSADVCSSDLAEQPENLPARHVECHIVERLLAALVSFGEGIDFDGVLHGVRLSHEPAIAGVEAHEKQSLIRGRSAMILPYCAAK